jgi:small-conductance mechanosensitive channel
MKPNYLLSNQFKKIGWILFIPSMILGLLFVIFQFQPKFLDIKVFAILDSSVTPWDSWNNFFVVTQTNATDEIIGILLIISLFLIAFSKEKTEDEFISKIRLESLLWATYINYAILIFAILFVYGGSAFWILVYNIFTVLIFFIIRFNWVIRKSGKLAKNEK